MAIEEVPYIHNREILSQYPFGGGGGADVIFIAGEVHPTIDKFEMQKFTSYYAVESYFKKTYPIDYSNSPLLRGLKELFTEGDRRSGDQTITLTRVYAMNIGVYDHETEREKMKEAFYEAALRSEYYTDIQLEVYYESFWLDDLDTKTKHEDNLYYKHIQEISKHLEDDSNVSTVSQYRQAVYNVHPYLENFGETLDEMIDRKLKITEVVKNQRVMIIESGRRQAKYAAKVACTSAHVDPCKDPYRSVTTLDLKHNYSIPQQERLIKGGLVVDSIPPIYFTGENDKVVPVRSISSAYAVPKEERRIDANTHIRRNVDRMWSQSDKLALAQLKNNNTDTGRGTLETVLSGYFEERVKEGAIVPKKTKGGGDIDKGYMVHVEVHPDDMNKLTVFRSVRPVGAIYAIDMISTILAPSTYEKNNTLDVWG